MKALILVAGLFGFSACSLVDNSNVTLDELYQACNAAKDMAEQAYNTCKNL